MKIYQQGQSIGAEPQQGAARTSRSGSSSGAGQIGRARQVGLDRVDISETAHTANQVLDTSFRDREARINQLSQLVQSGGYSVDLSSLANFIIDSDMAAVTEDAR